MFSLLFAACGGMMLDTNASLTDTGDEAVETSSPFTLAGSGMGLLPATADCEETVYSDGLTLFGLTPGHQVVVTAVTAEDEDPMDGGLELGEVLYQSTVTVDACETATPFSQVELADLGGFASGWDTYLFALVLDQPETYTFLGTLFESDPDLPPETPVSTQWVPVGDISGDGRPDYSAVRDPDLGVWIGIFMIP